MEERGVIKHRDFATQIRDFRHLRYGKITPTDIDGLIDFGNKVFVIMETKHEGALIPFGQRLAIERLADIIDIAGKHSLALIASHNTDGDIDFSQCLVSEFRFKGKWGKPNNPTTIKKAIDGFLKKHAPEYLVQIE
jgi:hypothetical protein